MRCKQGFTLIELLVVVLIIGVLAAVALPQYNKAIIKARFSNTKQILSSVVKAEQAFHLANGEYSSSLQELDLTFGQCTNRLDQSVFSCDNNWVIDIIYDNLPVIEVYYCPGNANTYSACNTNKIFKYRVWMDESKSDECTGYTVLGQSICQSIL